MTHGPAAWRDPAPLARAVVWGQWALGGLSALMAGFDLVRIALLAGVADPLPTDAAPSPYGQVAFVGGMVALGFGLVSLVIGVLSLAWIARTNRNAHAWAPDMVVSPRWAVGWFFVPIAGLWKPFQGVSETWRASVDPAGWRALQPPLLLRWWWGLFLIDNLVGQVSGRLELTAHAIGPERAAATVSLVSDGTGVVMAIVFERVVTRLTALQTGRATGGEGRAFDAAEVFGPR